MHWVHCLKGWGTDNQCLGLPGACGLLSSCPLPCSLMRRPPLLPLGAGTRGPCERPGNAFWLGAPVCPLRAPAVQSHVCLCHWASMAHNKQTYLPQIDGCHSACFNLKVFKCRYDM